jgi:hypothetical protein
MSSFTRLRTVLSDSDLLIEASMPSVNALYRRFDSLHFAQDFCLGRILISTLQRCRSIEDTTRRDEEEGEYRYPSGLIHPLMPDYGVRLKNAGYDPTKYHGTIINDEVISYSIRDAWILCVSDVSDSPNTEKFGAYIVRIEEPIEFFAELSYQLFQAGLMTRCALGPVVYSQRTQRPEQLPIAPAPFIKPTVYQGECEYRMVWMHRNTIEMVPQVFAFERVQRFLNIFRHVE